MCLYVSSCSALFGTRYPSVTCILESPAPAALSSPTQDVAMEMLLHQAHTRNDLILTLKVLVTTIDAQWEGMGDVGSARYEIQSNDYCH